MIVSITTLAERDVIPKSMILANKLHIDLQSIHHLKPHSNPVVIYIPSSVLSTVIERLVLDSISSPQEVHLLMSNTTLSRISVSSYIRRYFPEAYL